MHCDSIVDFAEAEKSADTAWGKSKQTEFINGKNSLFGTFVLQENHYAMRLDETRKEEVSRALFTRLRREKAPKYTVEAASGSQKVGEDTVLSCFTPLLKCGQIENQTYQTTWNY